MEDTPQTHRRHHAEASARLAAVRDIVHERTEGPDAPSWCHRRGWTSFLAGLSADEVACVARDGLAAHVESFSGAPADLVDLARAVTALTDLPRAKRSTPIAETRRATLRKRAQVGAFATLLAPLAQGRSRVVDVGSGHGHLTRYLARTAGVDAEGWDHDPDRVAIATSLTHGEPARFIAADVREAPLHSSDLVVGLHACGELGDHAVRAASAAGAAIALVGCCLQKRAGDREALVIPSGVDADSLTIAHAALGLANARLGEQGIEDDLATRTTSRVNRLALTHALRAAGHDIAPGEELRGVNRRRATGSLDDLVARAFAARGLAAPTSIGDAARAGRADFERMRRWELPRAMLARLVEVWVALDRAAFLEERGYEVEVLLAFDESASPRNVAIVGRPATR